MSLKSKKPKASKKIVDDFEDFSPVKKEKISPKKKSLKITKSCLSQLENEDEFSSIKKQLYEEISPKKKKVSDVKFISLEEFDNKSNTHLAEFKGVFEQLESFKKSINKKPKVEAAVDPDFDF